MSFCSATAWISTTIPPTPVPCEIDERSWTALQTSWGELQNTSIKRVRPFLTLECAGQAALTL